MKTLFQKLFLMVTLLALTLLAIPTHSASAAGLNAVTSLDSDYTKTRLEWAFANQKLTIERMSLNLAYQDEFIAHIEELLKKAKENGKDVSAVEAALTEYKKAVEASRMLYEQAVQLAQTHEGFDANGKVTDLNKARETVKLLAEILQKHRETMEEALKALRDALKTLRNPNSRPARP